MTRDIDWVLPPEPEEPDVDEAVYVTVPSSPDVASDAILSGMYDVLETALIATPFAEEDDVR